RLAARPALVDSFFDGAGGGVVPLADGGADEQHALRVAVHETESFRSGSCVRRLTSGSGSGWSNNPLRGQLPTPRSRGSALDPVPGSSWLSTRSSLWCDRQRGSRAGAVANEKRAPRPPLPGRHVADRDVDLPGVRAEVGGPRSGRAGGQGPQGQQNSVVLRPTAGVIPANALTAIAGLGVSGLREREIAAGIRYGQCSPDRCGGRCGGHRAGADRFAAAPAADCAAAAAPLRTLRGGERTA